MRSLRLEDTPHCGHFRTHRTQYCAAIAAFVKHDVQVNPPAKFSGMRRVCHGPLLVVPCYCTNSGIDMRSAQRARLLRQSLHVTQFV